MNPLRRLLPGSGRLFDDLRTAPTAEGIVFLDEGLAGSVTYRNYRAPARVHMSENRDHESSIHPEPTPARSRPSRPSPQPTYSTKF